MTVKTISMIYFVIFIVAMLVIAVISGKQKVASNGDKAKEQFLGGNSIPFAVLAISYGASFASSGSFMGDPAVVSTYGYAYLWLMVFANVGTLLVTALIVRKMRVQCERLGAMSPTEYVSIRFDSKFLRGALGIICAASFFMSIIAQFKAASVLLNHFTGIPFASGVVIVAIVVIACTVVGGLRSVAWTDAVQGVMMAGMTILLLVTGMIRAGGFKNIDVFFEKMNPESVQLVHNEMWSDCGLMGVIGLIIFGLFVMPAQPYLTSRYMAIKGITRKAIVKYALVLLVFSSIFSLNNFTGLCGRVLFPDAEADYIVVTLATGVLPPVISCLIMIGLFAAILTTSTSMLLTIGQSIGRDFMTVVKSSIKEHSQVQIANVTCIIIAVLAVIFNIYRTPELLTVFNLIGLTGVGASIAMPMYMGVLYKKSTKEAAIASCITGFVSTIILNLFVVELVGWGVGYGAPFVFAVLAFVIVNPIVLKTKGLDPVIESRGDISKKLM